MVNIQELRKRPQALFRIPTEKQSPSNWQSVSSILKEGVEKSTLPCAKLRAIVNAAKEIAHIHADDRVVTKYSRNEPTDSKADQSGSALGADDFLPIFIYCVVRAEVERPCALCKCFVRRLRFSIPMRVVAHVEIWPSFVSTCSAIFPGVLLRTLCERSSRIGETGYYLASFEAAIAYITEIDLSEDN